MFWEECVVNTKNQFVMVVVISEPSLIFVLPVLICMVVFGVSGVVCGCKLLLRLGTMTDQSDLK